MRSADATSDVLLHVGNSPSAEYTIKPAHRDRIVPGKLYYVRFLYPVPSLPFWYLVTCTPQLIQPFPPKLVHFVVCLVWFSIGHPKLWKHEYRSPVYPWVLHTALWSVLILEILSPNVLIYYFNWISTSFHQIFQCIPCKCSKREKPKHSL